MVAAAERIAEAGPFELGWQLADSLRAYLFACQDLSAYAPLYERALKVAETTADPLGQAAMRHSLGLADWARGDLLAALAHYRAALRQYRHARHLPGELDIMINMAISLERMGRSVRGRKAIRKAIARHRYHRGDCDMQVAGMEFIALAHIGTSLGQLREAVDYATRGIMLARSQNHPRPVVEGLLARAFAGTLCGRHERALADYTQALKTCQEHSLHRNEALAHHGLARLHLAAGDPATARGHAETAITLTADQPDRWSQAQALDAYAAARLADGDAAEAAAYHDRAAQLARANGYHGLLAQTTIGLADSAGRREDFAAAVRHARRAIAMARKLRHPVTECRALATLSRLYGDTGRQHEAADCLQLAAALRDRTGLVG